MILLLLRLVWNLIRLPLLPLWALGRVVGRPRAQWVRVSLSPKIVEFSTPRHELLRRLIPTMDGPSSLVGLRRLAARVNEDRAIQGVIFELRRVQAGWAVAQGLRDVMQSLRQAGKTVVVYLPEGGSNKELYVASAADRLVVSPQATMIALGLSAESRYFKPLLDKAGIEVEGFARAEYKTAVEPFVRESMSEAQREQVGALLDEIDRALRAAIMERPGVDEDAVSELFARVFLRAPELVERSIADDTGYLDELPVLLGEPKAPSKIVDAKRYQRFHDSRFFTRLVAEPYIAIVPLSGAIGAGPRSQKVVAALRLARKDKRAKGVVLAVSSPGGSANISDLIHREVVRLKEKKPVVAFFSDVAASGGYYVATHASAIVAQPLTITGSIGVVSARFAAKALLDRFGVRTEIVKRAPHADMFSLARNLDDDERAILERELDAFYDSFVSLVAEGRGRDKGDIEAVAKGRVWAGVAAQRRGLVDHLGGLDLAIHEACTMAGSPSLKPQLVVPRRLDVPPPDPPEAVQAAISAFLGPIAPEMADLVSCLGPEEALFFAVGVPSIR